MGEFSHRTSNKPDPSVLKTFEIPAIGLDPAILHQAADRTVRVVVRNVGGNLIFLAHDTNALQTDNVAPSEAFQLAPNQELVLVLVPSQQLLSAGQGGGGQAS